MAERMCAVTRQSAPSHKLLRFVCGPDGQVVPDIACRLPGRGLWVGTGHKLVGDAVARKCFARGLGGKCQVPDGLADMVDGLLASSALGYLSLANKAGLAVTGYEKVLAGISTGRIEVLIAACDGARDGREKLLRKARTQIAEPALAEIFTSAQLGLALGRENVIHAGLAHGALAEKFVAATGKLSAYREN